MATLIAAVIIALPFLHSAAAFAEPYSLRTFRLGMTLDEFRSTPHPDPGRYGDVRLFCTGDRQLDLLEKSIVVRQDALELRGSETEQKAGIRKCRYFWLADIVGSKEWMPGGLVVANIGVGATFYFLQDRSDPLTYRLFKIHMTSNTQHFEQFLAAYKERFGSPQLLRNESVQNKLGAVFDSVVAIWKNEDSTIVLQQRGAEGRVDLMPIVYTHDKLIADLAKRIEAIEGKPSDKL